MAGPDLDTVALVNKTNENPCPVVHVLMRAEENKGQ